MNVDIFRARHDDIVFARTKCKYVNPHQIYMFIIASLAWTYSSLVAKQRTQSREKQTERERGDSIDKVGGGELDWE